MNPTVQELLDVLDALGSKVYSGTYSHSEVLEGLARARELAKSIEPARPETPAA